MKFILQYVLIQLFNNLYNTSTKNKINIELVEKITQDKLCQYELYEQVEGWLKAIRELI